MEYEAVYYHPDAEYLMGRLQSELPRALHALAEKGHSPGPGPSRVIKFTAPALHYPGTADALFVFSQLRVPAFFARNRNGRIV